MPYGKRGLFFFSLKEASELLSTSGGYITSTISGPTRPEGKTIRVDLGIKMFNPEASGVFSAYRKRVPHFEEPLFPFILKKQFRKFLQTLAATPKPA